MKQQFIAWYAQEYRWLNETVDEACILQMQDDHFLVKKFGCRFTLYRQVGNHFEEVFDGGSDRAKAETELLRRKDPSFYWTIPQKIQNFTDKVVGDFALNQYQRIKAEARNWNLNAARMRGKLTALQLMTVSELETHARQAQQEANSTYQVLFPN